MGVKITLRLDLNEVEGAVNRIEELLRRPLPITRRIATEVLPSAVEDNFAAEGARGSNPEWVDLAERTKKARAKRGYWPGKKLQASGRLIDSFEPFYDNQVAGLGNNLVYAATHEFGDPSRNIPERSFLALVDEDWGDIEAIVGDEVARVVERGG